jgi:class 3 adenylate cyclase/predicted ATPase
MTDVAAWLKELGLERYEPAFRESEITTAVLPELTEADLKELGLPLGPRKLLLRAIALLTTRSASEPTPASTTTSREAERRQLTVMFVDLVGSTELASRLDPEDMREVLRAYQDASAGVIARFEGFVAKFMGDGVLAYFGYPRAHEDEAERAVRAGLALAETVGQLKAPTGEALAARVGIATGLVVVGDLVGEGASQEQAVVGETPNMAARLQALAPPGRVVISEATRRLLGADFDLQDLGPKTLKGLPGPARPFAVGGARATQSRFEARSGPSLMPMVGRDQELALLLERWVQAKTGEGQGVLLVGEAGIGKSRISRALLDALVAEPHFRIHYQCSPYHVDSALWPVIQQLTHAAGLAAADPVETKLDRLEALLGRARPGAIDVAPLIAELVGLDGVARYGKFDLTPQIKRARTLEALVDQLLGLAAQQPVLMVLEDAHWIDPTTLELVAQCLDRIADARVLLLLTSRPDHQPALAAHPHVTRLTLNRLGRLGVEAIVMGLSDRAALAADVIDAIIARTDGVPLFVEELTKAVLETGETTIPASLHDSLMARLDRIPEVKEVAQTAACIGREFDFPLLAAVENRSEQDLLAALDRLAAAELIFRRGTPPAVRYLFKHALVRDAAYESLLRSRRQEIHARIARTIEERFAADALAAPEIVARHFSEAGLLERAVDYWRRAGLVAIGRSAYVEAAHHLEEGLGLVASLPRTAERAYAELGLWRALGGARAIIHGYAASETGKAYERALALCRELSDEQQLLPVLFGQWVNRLNRSEFDHAEQAAREFLERATQRDDPSAVLVGHTMIGSVEQFRGRLSQARVHHETTIALYQPERDQCLVAEYVTDRRIVAKSLLSVALVPLGHWALARRHSDEAVAEARTLAHAATEAYATWWATVLAQLRGDPEGMDLLGTRFVDLARELQAPFWRGVAMVHRGWVQSAHGESRAAIETVESGLATAQATGATFFRPHYLGVLASVCVAAGDRARALSALEDALRETDRTGERWIVPELYRAKAGILADGRARMPEAENLLSAAIKAARALEARGWELRAARDLARAWAEQGERQKAYDLLAPVYDWFAEGFDTADLKDAKAVLEELR